MNRGNCPKSCHARRLVLLASAAGLAVAVVAASPTRHVALTLPSLAITSAQAADAVPSHVGFADIVEKVKPAVISVRVKIDDAAKLASMHDNDEEDATPLEPQVPYKKFFKQFSFPGMPNGMPQGRQEIIDEGSGFFISSDGYAVTNHHVVGNTKTVQVTTDDGTVYKAKVVGSDAKTDLALIKVETDNSFPFVKFAKKVPRVGEWVVAVGSPFGLGGTVTAGIVSARGRDIGSGPYDDYLQIDAPINKGNSGGPAFNMDGEVVGVNTAIFSPSGGSVGIGFDVPADTAKMVVAQLKEHGSVKRAWLGVQIQPVTAEIADGLGLKKAEGAIVAQQQADSPAAQAGIATGDVITAINGVPVKDARDLAQKIGMARPGTSIKLSLLHEGKAKTIDLVLGRMPGEKQARAGSENNGSAHGLPRLGLALAPAKRVPGSGDEGVVVVGVDSDGLAAEHGVKTGDVILDVGGETVTNAADVRKALAEAKKAGRHAILLRVKTADATRFIAIPFGTA